MDDTLKMLEELTQALGVPGQEDEVRGILSRYLAPYGELVRDNLGGIAVRKVGTEAAAENGPRVLIAGHMDEVGYMVSLVTADGYIRFQPLGGWWEQVMLAQRVRIRTRKGDIVGVTGSKAPHILPPEERNKVVQKRDMYIDIGAHGKEEVLAAGVRPGDPVVPICPFTVMSNPDMLLSKAWDNRIGCAIAVETCRLLKDEAHPNVLYAGATVQEEVGLRGAATLTHLTAPDVAIALDVGIAGDTPGIKSEEAQGKLGEGPVVLIYDSSLIPNTRLRDLVSDVAEAEGIPLQYDLMAAGGTDAGRMQLFGPGVPSIAIGVPARYIHSAASMISRSDFEQAAQLIAALVRRLDAETVAGLRG
jgi:putative aminopeptidase FrvX